MTTNAGRCPACGLPLNEPLPSHRRWRCPEIVRREDVRDAAQAMGLPRDAALWLILDTLAKRTEAEVRERLAEEVKALPTWNALRLEVPIGIVDHVRAAVLALIQPEGAKATGLREALAEVEREVSRAEAKHAPMHSPHEGHSVIREELDELWDHVRADTGRSAEARKEAIQIAAMGVRYALNLCEPEGEKA